MKIEVEIKDNKFFYNYKIGETSHNYTGDISPDFIICFTKLLEYCSRVTDGQFSDYKDQLTAEIWIKRNKEKAKAFVND